MSRNQPELVVWFKELCRANNNGQVTVDDDGEVRFELTSQADRKPYVEVEQYIYPCGGHSMFVRTNVIPLANQCAVYVENELYVVEVKNTLQASTIKSWKGHGLGDYPSHSAHDVGEVDEVTWTTFEFEKIDASGIASAKDLIMNLMQILTIAVET